MKGSQKSKSKGVQQVLCRFQLIMTRYLVIAQVWGLPVGLKPDLDHRFVSGQERTHRLFCKKREMLHIISGMIAGEWRNTESERVPLLWHGQVERVVVVLNECLQVVQVPQRAPTFINLPLLFFCRLIVCMKHKGDRAPH